MILRLTVVSTILDPIKTIDLYLTNYLTPNRVWSTQQSTYLKQTEKRIIKISIISFTNSYFTYLLCALEITICANRICLDYSFLFIIPINSGHIPTKYLNFFFWRFVVYTR